MGASPLRILVLYANPVTRSFGARLHSEVVTTLRSRGHEIDDCDLYAEHFDPVLSETERMQYHDIKLNRAPIAAYADRLLAAEATDPRLSSLERGISSDSQRLLRPRFHSRR
jgi:NAD(P)H dehydrogenase (quinone)